MKQKTHIHILDFNDSFTFNIASEIYKLDTSLQVIPFKKVAQFLEDLKTNEDGPQVLIYGPGPGAPAELNELLPLIDELRDKSNIFQMGICLGHQLFSILNGYEVKKSSTPRHGQKTTIKIPDWDVFKGPLAGKELEVQCYNSLAVVGESKTQRPCKELWHEGELFISSSCRCLTYQFHPESIGTSFRGQLFAPLLDFLYNEGDEYAN